nr:GPI-anchored protein LLG2-like [Ipomoea batatas]
MSGGEDKGKGEELFGIIDVCDTHQNDRLDDSPGEEGRSLLPRGPADCPFDVENMNYKIVTSQCKKEPNYNAKICCTAFKKLTCKYRDDLNSNPTACATEMFYYLRRYGNYPAGLFLNLCKEGNNGLDCLGY